MKKKFLNFIKISILLYVLFCGSLYLFQEKIIFFPEKLEPTHSFSFEAEIEEISIEAEDGIKLNSILFKAENSKGLIFYLHGNAGSLKGWGDISDTYTDLGYDLFILDYRGFGKSEGEIKSQEQLFLDVQSVYDLMLNRYNENEVVVIGYSIGTGLATKIASENSPKQLILQAPYYSLLDMMREKYPIVPTFLLKYILETNKYIVDCDMPVCIFHGKEDRLISYNSSLRLNELIKSTDELIILDNQGHNGITNNPDYKIELKRILK